MRLLIAALTVGLLPGAVLGQTPRERVVAVSAGGAVSPATDLYLGDVRTSWRPHDGRPSVFNTRYTERMSAQREGWLALTLETGPYAWALRLRGGSVATEAAVRGNIEPARQVAGRSSWVGAPSSASSPAGRAWRSTSTPGRGWCGARSSRKAGGRRASSSS